MNLLALFCALMIGHAVADYPLQGDFIGRWKNRYHPQGSGIELKFQDEIIWPWVLGAHAAIHAGAVWFVTGSAVLAAAEFIVHALIDYGKGAGLYGSRHAFAIDQSLHVACKVLWVAALAAGQR